MCSVDWHYERFANFKTMPFRGWESVTVPGAVSSWLTLSERFGDLPFETLFGPAIKYANDGFAVSPIISKLWEIGAQELKNEIGFAENFMRNNKAPKFHVEANITSKLVKNGLKEVSSFAEMRLMQFCSVLLVGLVLKLKVEIWLEAQ